MAEVNETNLARATQVTRGSVTSREIGNLVGTPAAVPTATSGNVVVVVNQLRGALLALGAITDGD